MLKKVLEKLQNANYLVIILSIITLVITGQSFLLGMNSFDGNLQYTHYNNYRIFVDSYFHLIQYKDLYQLYPLEHWDLFKYSPTFALFMAPFAYLPEYIGLFLWNLLNVLILFFAIWKFPIEGPKTRLLMLAIVLVELITSIQSSQSNAMVAGLIVLAYICLEKNKIAWATLFVVLTVFIKIFGLLAFVLFLFYPQKIKSIAYTMLWTIVLIALPLIVVSPEQLLFQYKSWGKMLANDHSISYGLSVAGWLYNWFGVTISKNIILLVGAIVFLLPLLKFKCFKENVFKQLYLASILVWVVIFNHKAESPTFIIAVTGIAVWYFAQPHKHKIFNTSLLIFAIVFTVLSPTDIFPKVLRENLVIPYVLKALPCIFIWFKIIYDLLTYSLSNDINKN